MLDKLKWCGKPVIPLIYTESLSYMEMVGKCMNKINELIIYVTDVIVNQIEQELSRIVLNYAYDETTETLTLNLEVSDNE